MAARAGPCASEIPPTAAAEAVATKPRRERSGARPGALAVGAFALASLAIETLRFRSAIAPLPEQRFHHSLNPVPANGQRRLPFAGRIGPPPPSRRGLGNAVITNRCHN